jgi:hypothetical protein
MDPQEKMAQFEISLNCIVLNKRLHFPRVQFWPTGKHAIEIYIDFGKLDFTVTLWYSKYEK